jgi:transcriptional regulator with XRE-family HTH domain
MRRLRRSRGDLGRCDKRGYQRTLCPSYPYVYIVDMEISGLVKDARRAAGITQARLANNAGTVQPAVAAYESGARTPTIATLTRLLDACECDLEIRARPRTRRGATALDKLARSMIDDLAHDREQDALRLLFGFADDFRGSSRPGKISLIQNEPSATGDARFDAALAGAAEFFAQEGAIPAPSWTEGSNRFVGPCWVVASRPAFEAYTRAHTHPAFARHGVFIAEEVFDRA